MLDVHAPHKPIEGVKEFLFHIFTITVGLLIALGLEGVVEWQHHRHLVHEAEADLHAEIQHNSASLQGTLNDMHKEEGNLRHDIQVLHDLVRTHKMPENSSMEIGYRIVSFDDVSWRTAQTTGALAYMSYTRAKEYSQIYDTQAELDTAERQAARDAILSLAPFVNSKKDDPGPTPEQATAIAERIETLQGQLLLVDSLMGALDRSYRSYLAAHPE